MRVPFVNILTRMLGRPSLAEGVRIPLFLMEDSNYFVHEYDAGFIH